MFAVFLFVVVFSFYCWLFSTASTSLQDNVYLRVGSENKCIPKGWDCVEGRDWTEDVCPLSNRLRKLLSFYTIRELKHFASDRHIKAYGSMTKAQLIEALAA